MTHAEKDEKRERLPKEDEILRRMLNTPPKRDEKKPAKKRGK